MEWTGNCSLGAFHIHLCYCTAQNPKMTISILQLWVIPLIGNVTLHVQECNVRGIFLIKTPKKTPNTLSMSLILALLQNNNNIHWGSHMHLIDVLYDLTATRTLLAPALLCLEIVLCAWITEGMTQTRKEKCIALCRTHIRWAFHFVGCV